jgi:hypothetical protein
MYEFVGHCLMDGVMVFYFCGTEFAYGSGCIGVDNSLLVHDLNLGDVFR